MKPGVRGVWPLGTYWLLLCCGWRASFPVGWTVRHGLPTRGREPRLSLFLSPATCNLLVGRLRGRRTRWGLLGLGLELFNEGLDKLLQGRDGVVEEVVAEVWWWCCGWALLASLGWVGAWVGGFTDAGAFGPVVTDCLLVGEVVVVVGVVGTVGAVAARAWLLAWGLILLAGVGRMLRRWVGERIPVGGAVVAHPLLELC